MKINQLIQARNQKLYETGVLFILLIVVALVIDHLQENLFTQVISILIKLASLYGLILLSQRIREPVSCPCCTADLSFDIYAKNKTKGCPFCKIRFDQDSVAYKRKLDELKDKQEDEEVVDDSFFEDALKR